MTAGRFTVVCIATLVLAFPADHVGAQERAAQPTSCAALLAEHRSSGTESRQAPPAQAPRSDTVSTSIGGARTGGADILLLAAVQANEVRFNSQPRVRIRLCWAGDTLRVVTRENLPSPVVAGTTYRNVHVAVELLGRLNAECTAGIGSCSFLGVRAGAGAVPERPPSP